MPGTALVGVLPNGRARGIDGIPDRLTLTPLARIAHPLCISACKCSPRRPNRPSAHAVRASLSRACVRACVRVPSLCPSPAVMMVTSDRGGSVSDGAVDAAAAKQLTREQHELLTASSALEGVLVRTVSEASTLELVKHQLLMISLEALDDLNERFSNERVVGFVANPSAMPSAMPSAVVAALAAAKSSSAQQATSS